MVPSQPLRVLLIVNANSRRGRAEGDRAADLLDRAGLIVRRETCDGREAMAATIRRYAGAVDAVVIGGGDGTLNAAAPALIDTQMPLGIVPLGTANDLARTLSIPADPDEATAVIAAAHTRQIDVGEVNGIPFFNVASLGLSENITREASQAVKKQLGTFAYVVAAARVITRTRPFSAEIRIDGNRRRIRTIQIAVGNGRHYGGGLTIADAAAIDDGHLDVYSLETDSLWKLALIYPAFRKGRHAVWQEVRTARCAEIEVRTRGARPIDTDGEITTSTPARFRVRPKAVTVFVPSGLADENHNKSTV